MSRITNDIAKDVARKMTSNKLKEIEDFNKETSRIAREYIVKDVPKEVIDFQKKHPKYTNISSSICFTGNGCNHIHIYVDYFPSIIENGNTLYHNPTAEMGVIMSTRENKLQDMKKEIKHLKESIEVALKSMRTFNKVKEMFPEAYEFLPKTQQAMLPSINIDSIREKLK